MCMFAGREGRISEEAGLDILLCLFLIRAGWTDLRSGKVYNRWLILGTAVGIWLRGCSFFPPAAAALVIAYVLYFFRLLGAGDGKLIAVMMGWLGAWEGLYAIFAGLMVAVLWSLCRTRERGWIGVRLRRLYLYMVRMLYTGQAEQYDGLWEGERDGRIPLAACLAVGTVIDRILRYFV